MAATARTDTTPHHSKDARAAARDMCVYLAGVHASVTLRRSGHGYAPGYSAGSAAMLVEAVAHAWGESLDKAELRAEAMIAAASR